ncbi:isochorismate synthase [Leucobacter sp. W1038]|uniref:isochorismate synthase n=1 Tax=Leucobacter sp. W1038 TaxID=3438281 RepID=UPI003D95BB90
MNSGSPHRLYAVTRPLASLPSLDDLLSFADSSQPLLWTRGDRGCVGIGETQRLSFTGPDRFTQASAVWRSIAAAAEVDDSVRLPGSGLLAFGTFAFSSASESTSVLIVPRMIVARHRGTAWVTEIAEAPIGRDPLLPASSPIGAWIGTDLPTTEPNAAYLAGVREASARIARGSVEKIVLSRQVHGWIRAEDDLRVPLRRLAERYDDCWTFAVDGLIGASPETLIRQTDGAISARVLAGTRARRPDPAADARARDELLTSTKEQHEHSFAVQSVVTALAPHVAKLHTSEEPFALQLPNVWHLATDLGATPGAGGTSLELTAALHPTAAVAGTPTSQAVASIAEIEPFDRGRYAGAVGWIDADGDGEWVIALRCAQVTPTDQGRLEVTATAGGGIVAGSDPDREFGETVSKFTPIAEAFGA